jgi:ribonuclease-3
MLARERKIELLGFCRSLGVKFKDLSILNLALVHRSLTNELLSARSPLSLGDGGCDNGEGGGGEDEGLLPPLKLNNERLEFLGDAILGAVTATLLYKDYGEKTEGELAKIKSVVVSEDILCGIARELQLDNVLLLGRGEERSGGRTKNAILADAFEALVAALYLDSGYKAAFDFVEGCVTPEIKRVVERGYHRDYKSLLQEYCQQKWRKYPLYKCTNRGGKDHESVFWVEVTVNNKVYGPCAGKNKKTAEQEAARRAYEDSLRNGLAGV